MKYSVLTILAGAAIAFSPVTAHAESKEITYKDMPAGVYALDKGHASLTWKVSHLGLSDYTARFTEFDAEFTYDPAAPEASVLTVSVNPASLKTDYPFKEEKDFDKKLVEGEDWFNAGEHSKIEFKSNSVEVSENNTAKVMGDLTFLGVTKPMTLDVTLNGVMIEQPFSKKPTFGFSATGTVKRSEWGMDTYVPNIGDDVDLLIEVEFAKQVVSDKASE